MTTLSSQQFWHAYIGKHFPDSFELTSHAAILPHRGTKGIINIRIGAIDAFYVAHLQQSIVFGRIELPSMDGLCFVGTEKVSARKELAAWLIHKATAPFMVGFLGKADAASSMRITHDLSLAYFCDAGGSFEFNLRTVRNAYQLIGHLPWKKVVAPAIHQYNALRIANEHELFNERMKMQKILTKTPELAQLLPQLQILPNSGEYSILSWFNIEKN